MEFCLGYTDQAVQHGFRSLVVLGGDKHVGRPRCVEHAWQLRRRSATRHPELELGGWANPDRRPDQPGRVPARGERNADFYLTQIVSHHQAREVEAFLDEARKRGVTVPGVFGVFYYRSAKPETLETLQPVPAGAGRRS